ncbi:MAG: pyridoxal kinase [Gammaproteobacteria bacterium]|nr:pyridoxal kinase [Gammaproteobacteria bacterium]
MSILSIQSHVAYGYVGNKAAVFPLQSMGYDVWPINTVQFSNQTGYGKWQGEIFSPEHIRSVVNGLEDLGVMNQCEAILSGYMGSRDICYEVQDIVKNLKLKNPNLLYLCDPVIGNTSCYVKPEVLEFFKTNLWADIITPNQFEAETLSGMKIENINDLKKATQYFHGLGIKIVVITGVKISDLFSNGLSVVISHDNLFHAVKANEYIFETSPNGTGDLFSAVFLGSYLETKDSLLSLQRTVYFADQVLKNTFDTRSKELKVISVNYANVINEGLPEFLAISE